MDHCTISQDCCISLLPQGVGDVGIIAKEACSSKAQCPCNDYGAISSVDKDNNGGDQVEGDGNEGPEEINPRPVDGLYLGG